MNLKSLYSVSKTLFAEHSSELFLGAGLAFGTFAVVSAAKSSNKLNNVLDESKSEMDDIHEAKQQETITETELADLNKRTIKVYGKTMVNVTKVFTPTIGYSILAVTCLLKSYNVLSTQKASLIAAYTSLDQGFKDYRSNVLAYKDPNTGESIGEQLDKHFRYGLTEKEIDVKTTDPKSGEVKTKKQKIDVLDDTKSEYLFVIDSKNRNWESNMDYNMMWIEGRDSYMDHVLKERYVHQINCGVKKPRGVVTCAEYLLSLDYEFKSEEEYLKACSVGWEYRPGLNEKGDELRDGHITSRAKEAYIENDGVYESVIILDPNVDGVILQAFN